MTQLPAQQNPCQWCGADIFSKRGQPMDLTYAAMQAAVSGRRITFQHHCRAKAEAYGELVKSELQDRCSRCLRPLVAGVCSSCQNPTPDP